MDYSTFITPKLPNFICYIMQLEIEISELVNDIMTEWSSNGEISH